VLSLLVTALLARAFHEPRIPAAQALAPLARGLVCDGPGPCQGAERSYEESARAGVDVVIWDAMDGCLFMRYAPAGPFSRGLMLAARFARSRWLTHLGDGAPSAARTRPRRAAPPLFLPLLIALAVMMAIGFVPCPAVSPVASNNSRGSAPLGAGDLGHRCGGRPRRDRHPGREVQSDRRGD